ncbi:MAG: hypothetical protein ACLFMX_01785 [Halobacteriales archaeon]
MSADAGAVVALQAHIESAEEAYEFLISYAGRGLDRHQPPGTTEEVREALEKLDAAMVGGVEAALAVPDEHDIDGEDPYRRMLDRMEAEVAEARTIVSLIAAQSAITSAQVDNMNGMSVFQSVMMKFFFLDELTTHLAEP